MKKIPNRPHQVGLCITALSIASLFASSALAAGAVSFELMAPPAQGYLSNTIIDFASHGGGVWGATGKGISFTLDGGQTWQYYNSSNATGLVSDNVSALYSTGSRFWVATNHNKEIDGGLISVSDGVAYTDDNGLSWTRIDFETPPNNIPYVWGGDRTVFDITGYTNGADKDYVFFSAFAGGFLGSADGGTTWKRVFPSRGDSAQFYDGGAPSLRNRYFSCVSDSSHGDTVMIYAGTAAGLLQYSFVDKHDKPFSKIYNAIAFRDQNNADTIDNYVFLGGDLGLTRARKKGGPFLSRFADDGLTEGNITALLDFRGKLIVGTRSISPDSTSHLRLSIDRGETFIPTAYSEESSGPNTKISDFAVIGERIYMAAQAAGLFVSADSGINWTQLYVDSANLSLANGWNTVNALDPLGDTLRVGTDSGLATIYMDPSGVFQSMRKLSFPENGSSSTRIVEVKTQTFFTSNVFDSLAVWTVNQPLNTGTNIVARSIGDADTAFGSGYQVGITIHDLGFLGDTAFVVGPNGIGYTYLGDNPVLPYYVKEFTTPTSTVVVDSLTLDTITTIEIQGDTLYLGTRNGYAYSQDHGTHWNIVRINQSPIVPDFVAAYYVGINGISGDWFPALGVQKISDSLSDSTGYPFIWATSRPTYSGYDGISVGWMRHVDDSAVNVYHLSWNSIYKGVAWNYAFNGDTAYAATDAGLIYTTAYSVLNDTVVIWDTIDLEDENGDPFLLPGTPVYAVAVVDSFLWVGTGDRTVRINLNDFSQTAFNVEDSTTPSDEVYAFPIPFSHAGTQALDFHFQLGAQGNVTLEIYDFAMNLVRRVIDNETYPPGIYPATGSMRKTWDGKNGDGEAVAVGVYYFKVSLSTGDTRWGKIAVIP